MTFAINSIDVIGSSGEFIVLSSATTPSSPTAGRLFFNSTIQKFQIYTGTEWISINIDFKPSMFSWGLGTLGRLGDGTTVDKSSPVSVISELTEWVQVSAGSQHAHALAANGTAWSWGAGTNSRLGDGTTVDKSSPVSIVGGFTDWVQIQASLYHGVGIRSNGTAWTWGVGTNGRLGDGTTSNRSSPVSVVGGFTDWIQISGGQSHSIGLRTNGTIWGWGGNSSGQLGDGTITSTSSPVSVVGGFTDWVQISCGWLNSFSIRANGTAWCWGNNTNGQLGDNTTIAKSSPVSIVGGFTDWVQISGGYKHTAGIRANGTVWSWGYGLNGQLGDNTAVTKSSPVSVVGGFTDWVQLECDNHTTAIRANGTAWSWGYNGNGRLGDNTTSNRSSPVSVVGGFTDWVQISCGGASVGIRAR